jgi:hypothetical protein
VKDFMEGVTLVHNEFIRVKDSNDSIVELKEEIEQL